MMITVSEFWLGVIATIGIEVGASFLILLYFTIRYSIWRNNISQLESRRNASKSSKGDENE